MQSIKSWAGAVCLVTCWCLMCCFATDHGTQSLNEFVKSLGGEIWQEERGGGNGFSSDKNYTIVQLDKTQVNNADLAQLMKLGKINELSLRHTNIDDAGLASLRNINQRVFLTGTKVTSNGLSKLATALPEATIVYRPNCIREIGDPAQSVMFLPDNRTIMGLGVSTMRSPNNNAICLWDATTGKELARIEYGPNGHSLNYLDSEPPNYAISADGSRLAVLQHGPGGYDADDFVYVWDINQRQHLFDLKLGPHEYFGIIQGNAVNCCSLIAFSPDGSRLATFTNQPQTGAKLRVWDLQSRSVKQTWAITCPLTCIAFQKDETLVGIRRSGPNDVSYGSWNLKTGEESILFPVGHSREGFPVPHHQFAGDGAFLVEQIFPFKGSSVWDEKKKGFVTELFYPTVWNLQTKDKWILPMKTNERDAPIGVQLKADGQLLLTNTENHFDVYRLETRNIIGSLDAEVLVFINGVASTDHAHDQFDLSPDDITVSSDGKLAAISKYGEGILVYKIEPK